MYNVLSTGSEGNAVIYHKTIMVDCGVSFAKVKPFINDLQIALLTHEHKDHINLNTLKRIVFERPSLRIGCGEWMLEWLSDFKHKNIDVYDVGDICNYGSFRISPIKLFHDVPNFGYRIFKGDHKTIHCTDTAHLEGIEAKNYDLYAIEHNYNEDTIHESIENLKAHGEYAYQQSAINSHLSEQQARDFIYKNKGDKYEVLRLHESSNV